jgi:NADH-quinone oxidoreductase subunit J
MSNLGLVYFYGCAAAAVIGAIATIAAKNPIRGAMGLLLMILSIAGLFLALHAQFLAVIQLIVYAGAIVVLFLFVIMLLGPSATSPRDLRGLYPRAFGGALFGLGGAGGLFLVIRGGKAAYLASPSTEYGGVDAFGRELFNNATVPFELSSALLMIAVIGAIAVARGKQLSKERQLELMQAEVSTAKPPTIEGSLPGTSTARPAQTAGAKEHA